MTNIKFKLLIPTLLMVALALASTIYVSFLQYQTFQNQEKDTTGKHTSQLITLLQLRRKKNIALMHLLTNKKQFIKSALMRDRNALLAEMIPYFEQMEYGFVNLYDLHGAIIARADLPDTFGNPDELSPTALKLLETQETASLVTVYNGLLAVFSVTKLMGPSSPIGVLIVGNYLDQPSVDNIARTNNLDIKFYLNEDEIVSSSKYNKVIAPGSERTTLVDISEAGGGKESLKVLLIEDVSEAKKKFMAALLNIMLLMAAVSGVIIFFSRRTILSAADSLNSARISAEQKTLDLKSTNDQLESEIAERRMAEERLRRRDSILQALSFIGGRFLQTTDIDQNINTCLERLGAATDVSRIAIRKNHTDADGNLFAKRKYEWVAPGVASQMANEDYTERYYLASGLDSDALSRKQSFHGQVKDFPEALRTYFEKGGVESVLMVPIFVDNQWWGYIGFAECARKRSWDTAEIGVLGTAADIIGAAIYRRQADEDLLQARDRAMEASNTKSLFLANMSHEIRTPMNAIIGFTQMLERTTANKTQKEYLRIIGNSANTLLDIINSILDFSKIESGKFELEKTGFDIVKELEGMIETLSFKANEKSIDLVFNLDPMLPQALSGDSLRIKQVLINLIGNAIKFTDRGGYVHTRIVLESIDVEARIVNISFSVEDNGIGISKDKQGSILEPFTQADCSISREYGGTGLGLAISDNIVAMMGGQLSLESEQGKGTMFSFTLGFDMLDEEDSVGPKSMNLNLKVALCCSRQEEPSQERVVRKYLEHLGCSVYDLAEITDLVDIEDVHVLIMSISSIDIEAIRTARVITNAPIIAIAREYAAEIMEGSFDKVIYQPVYMSKLIDAIVEVTGTEMKLDGGNINQNDLEVMRFDAKVLVAEDVPTNQMLIKLIMGESGIDVDIASNGLEAVEKYRTGSYDVVFMDIHMPVCNGINATKMIREHEQMTMRPRTPIIALTADAIKGEKEHLLAEGMDDYITKPIDREALNAIFRKYIHVEAAGDVPEHSAGSRNAGFDIQGMAKSLGITEDMARLCLQDFFSSVDGDLEEFQANMNSRNRSGICEIAHKIKGTAANLRIDEIADICREVERIAKSGLTADDITVLNSKIERIAILKNNLWEMVGRQ